MDFSTNLVLAARQLPVVPLSSLPLICVWVADSAQLDAICVPFGCVHSRHSEGIGSDALVAGRPSVRAQQIVSK